MSSLIEVVFENVSKTKVVQLLLSLVNCATKILSADCCEDITLLDNDTLNKQALNLLINYKGDVSALIKFEGMEIDSILLPLTLLRLSKYDNHFDIDFTIDLEELQDIDTSFLVEMLHKNITKLAKENDVASWFAGMEPASDEDTRYFTQEELGPLK